MIFFKSGGSTVILNSPSLPWTESARSSFHVFIAMTKSDQAKDHQLDPHQAMDWGEEGEGRGSIFGVQQYVAEFYLFIYLFILLIYIYIYIYNLNSCLKSFYRATDLMPYKCTYLFMILVFECDIIKVLTAG